MYKLNLPDFDYKLKKAEGKVWIFDVIRKKFVVLTPEEWVRQHFIHFMTDELGYPRALVKIEGGLKFNALTKRTDIVLFDQNGSPWMVVECKSPTVDLSSHALQQASVYNTTLKAKFLVITNGIKHYCARTDWENGSTTLLDAMPAFK